MPAKTEAPAEEDRKVDLVSRLLLSQLKHLLTQVATDGTLGNAGSNILEILGQV